MLHKWHRRLLMTVGLLTSGTLAQAELVNVTLGAASAILGPIPVDVITTAGANVLLDLTLGVPVTQTFYTANYFAGCGTCTGTLNGTLNTALIIQDFGPFGVGIGSFEQDYTVDANGTDPHEFAALGGAPIVIALSNGRSFSITPLASSPTSVPLNGSSTQAITATFLLSTAVPIPEPASMALMGFGLVAGLLWHRRSSSRAV